MRLQMVAEDWRSEASASIAARDWRSVETAIAAAVRGDTALPGDGAPLLPSPWPARGDLDARELDARVTWRLEVAYLGQAFSGYAWQPAASRPTVEGCLQNALAALHDGRSELRLSCAGRTDAGVSALAQRVSFHASAGLCEEALAESLARASPAPAALRLVQARIAEQRYHATYSTAWRRYAYLLPPAPGQSREAAAQEAATIDALLRPLAGAPRDYAALGRSVPAGKNTTTLLRLCRCRLVELPAAPGGSAPFAARLDLVGDRFLRRQVRTLVATAVAVAAGVAAGDGAAAAGGDEAAALLALCTGGRQELTAHPAPAEGLVFVCAGGEDELEHEWRLAGEELVGGEEGWELLDWADGGPGLPTTQADAGGGEGGRRRAASRPGGKPAAQAQAAAQAEALGLLELQAKCGAPLDALLAQRVRARGLGPEERSSVAALLEGVSRRQGRIDARLRAAGVTPAPRSRLLASLRLSDGGAGDGGDCGVGLPEQTTAAERRWLSSLSPPLEGAEMDAASRLECPSWAWERFRAAYGDGVDAELRALQLDAPLDLRVNTLKATRHEALTAIRSAGFAAERTPYSPVGIRLPSRAVALGAIPGLREGVVDPQDEGSQLVALLLGAKPGEHVVDYCAGAGGKTLALAAQMRNKGRLVAMDVDHARLERGAPRRKKAGVDNVQTHVIEQGKDKWLKRRKRT